jgi:hypothetical protein
MPVTWYNNFKAPICNGWPIRPKKAGKRKICSSSPPKALLQEGQHNTSPQYQTPIQIRHQRNKSKTFTKENELLLLLYHVFFPLYYLFLPSLFSYSRSYPFHVTSFSCTMIHCSPSQLLFLPLLIHSPCFCCPILFFPNLSPHYSSLLHTHHPQTSLLYQPYTPPGPCNP